MCGLGFKEQFAKNSAFAHWIKLVLAIPLLPTNRITGVWSELKKDIIPNAEGIAKVPKTALNKFKKYMEKQWIVGKLEVLSVHGQTSRTNNDSEVYNKKWNNRLQIRNPNIWKCGEAIYAAFVDAEKDMMRLENNCRIARSRARKNVLNGERLRKAEAKLGTSYSSRDFLKAVIYSFSQSNKKYFEEMADDLEGDSELGEPEQFVDSDDESDNQQPEFYQDSEDEEIILNPVQAQPTQTEQQDETDRLCNICFMKEKNAVNIPCGHAKWCIECANTWFESRGTCALCRDPIDRCIRMFT